MLPNAQPKPKPRATEKRANRRVEAKIKRQVRAACVERDAYCRLDVVDAINSWGDSYVSSSLCWSGLGNCVGWSEWAHMGEKKRFKTRGMAPEARHTTADSLMLCMWHHRMYDLGELAITALSERGADGPLEFKRT